MKQIGIVLLLTALAALGFVLVRVLDAPPTAPKGTPQGGARTQGLGPRNQGPRPEPKVEMRTMDRPQFDFKAGQTTDWIVPMDEAWGFDLSNVDFDAPVLCRVGDVSITRDQFRAYVCLTDAAPLLEARLTWLLAKSEAERAGRTIGLSDFAFDTMLDHWAQARNLDREAALYGQSLSVRLSVPATRQMRRWSQEALLALFQNVAVYEQLPIAMRVMLEGTAASRDLGPVLKLLQEAQLDLEDPENLRKLSGSLDALAIFFGDVRRRESVRRMTSFLDDVLPAGTIATLFVGDLPEESMPPWLLAGEFATVTVEELWPFLGDGLNRIAGEQRLRELIWYQVLAAELRKGGTYPEPEPNWMAYWQEYQEASRAVFDLPFLQISLNGFPSVHHYRAFLRIQRGFSNAQPEGWRDESVLRKFADENRFFVQQWNPQIEVALFPAQRPVQGGMLRVDWASSKAGAEALHAQVLAGGDFTSLRTAQQQALVDEYRTLLGDADADNLREQFQLGRLELPLGELRNRLQERRYDELIDCTSVLRSAVAELDVGQVSPPWRTRLGYALIRLNGAIVAGLEREFEDVEVAASQFHDDFTFMKWANSVLRKASFEPG